MSKVGIVYGCSVGLLLCFLSCTQQEEQIPSNVISPESMVAILADIHLAEASSESRNLRIDEVNRIAAARYKGVFEKHAISAQQFTRSYDYYLEHAADLALIYAEVVNRLTEGQSRVSPARHEPEITRDTVKNMASRMPDSLASAGGKDSLHSLQKTKQE